MNVLLLALAICLTFSFIFLCYWLYYSCNLFNLVLVSFFFPQVHSYFCGLSFLWSYSFLSLSLFPTSAPFLALILSRSGVDCSPFQNTELFPYLSSESCTSLVVSYMVCTYQNPILILHFMLRNSIFVLVASSQLSPLTVIHASCDKSWNPTQRCRFILRHCFCDPALSLMGH